MDEVVDEMGSGVVDEGIKRRAVRIELNMCLLCFAVVVGGTGEQKPFPLAL